MTRRSLLTAAVAANAQYPDIRSVEPDLAVPPIQLHSSAGGRTRVLIPGWPHAPAVLYLPRDWHSGARYPVLLEYPGNGGYRNSWGDVSEGVPEGSNLGYGLSAGIGYLWAVLPYVNAEGQVATTWWGEVASTLRYCHDAVRHLGATFGADTGRVVLCGFSRGSIGCNFIGLHDDRVAGLWRGFFCYSHYDGVRTWPYPGSDRRSAIQRLQRLGSRPQFLIHENSIEPTQRYLSSTGVRGDFTFRTLPFRNHNDQWVLRDIPERRAAREWLTRVTG